MKSQKVFVVLAVMATASALAGIRTDVQMRRAANRVLKSSRPLEQVAYYPGMALYSQAGGGFAIISSDDNAPAVLAYSTNSILDLSDDNPGFNWWLNATRKVMLQQQPRRETTKPDPKPFSYLGATAIDHHMGPAGTLQIHVSV